MKISLKKPSGFKKKSNLVFVGISFSLISPGETELYNSGDINETMGAKGEDFTHYQKSCDITFTVSDVFGFRGRGNYKLKYRVWDKKSSNELTGEIPLFVEN